MKEAPHPKEGRLWSFASTSLSVDKDKQNYLHTDREQISKFCEESRSRAKSEVISFWTAAKKKTKRQTTRQVEVHLQQLEHYRKGSLNQTHLKEKQEVKITVWLWETFRVWKVQFW